MLVYQRVGIYNHGHFWLFGVLGIEKHGGTNVDTSMNQLIVAPTSKQDGHPMSANKHIVAKQLWRELPYYYLIN